MTPAPDASIDGGRNEDASTPRDATHGEDAARDLDADLGDTLDAGPGVTVPLAGFGQISGACGVLDTELVDEMPHLVRNVIDFGQDPYDMADLMALSQGGQRVIEEDNAGGSSLVSEAFAYEILYRCEGAELLKTETAILYDEDGDGSPDADYSGEITDLLVRMDGLKIGVSVVRAFAYGSDDYPAGEAARILEKKLQGINESSARVAPEDAWSKQILSVLAYAPQHADQIAQTFMALDPALRADTVLVVTVTEGEDRPLYYND